ncbi:MAG TPA: RNA methyltransferase [Thermodesulfobacteriota bacterium]|nr:RNA methyltransferase [Thermodesulfobacteriota bacterium]
MNLSSVSIILVRPKFPENIGSVARAMKNTGLSRLMVVNGCSPLHPGAYKLASGAEDILERAEEFFTFREAVSEVGCVIGTTSRGGKERSPDFTPEALAKKLIPISQKNLIGVAFGSEKEGLTNEELSLCHLYARIPSMESFPSLNLAQAAMVVCYALFQSSVETRKPSIELAQSEALEKMFDHMEKTLVRTGFLDAKHPKRIMRVLRRLLGRSQMNEREVQILQGIWSQMDHCLGKEKSLKNREGKDD